MRLDDGQIEVMDDEMVVVLRQKKPGERICIGFSLWQAAHDMLTVHLKTTHPEWNSATVKKEVARRLSRGAS